MTATAIIQARMGSSRFPGKVLKPLMGKEVLWHIVHRLKKSRNVTNIVVATSTEPSDDALESYCTQEGIACIRGPLDNVLARYVAAVDAYPADYIVRITGDAPLIDTETIDRIVETLARAGADRIKNDPRPSIHCGFEVVSNALFRSLSTDYGDLPAAQEHVTGYLGQRPELGKATPFTFEERHLIDNVHASIDTPADLHFFEKLYQQANTPAGDLDAADAVAILTAQPELLSINASVRQKTVDERTRRMLFITEAGGPVGMGHLARTLALAECSRTYFSYGVTIACLGETAAKVASDQGFSVRRLPPRPVAHDIETILAESPYDALVIDVRDGLTAADLKALRQKHAIPIALIDDAGDRITQADISFLPPTPQVKSLDWDKAGCKAKAGWQWLVLPAKRDGVLSPPPEEKRDVLISFGGSDPFGLTERVAKLLAEQPSDFKVSVLLGPNFENLNERQSQLQKLLPNAQILPPSDDMASLFLAHDAVITAYGITVFEALAHGCAVAFMPHSKDDAEASQAIATEGCAVSLGLHGDIDDPSLSVALRAFLGRSKDFAHMGEIGKRLFEDDSCQRIIKEIGTMFDCSKPD